MKEFPGKDFELLYKTKKPRLVAYARHFTESYAEACDIVQESFLKMWTCYPDYNPATSVPLIFRITRNCCIDNLRKKKVLRGIDLSFLESEAGEEYLYEYDFLGSSASEKCVLDELNGHIGAVLESLPQRCRQVFSMSRIDGLSNSEIAKALGISLPAVTKHIKKALSAIDSYFSELGLSSGI